MSSLSSQEHQEGVWPGGSSGQVEGLRSSAQLQRCCPQHCLGGEANPGGRGEGPQGPAGEGKRHFYPNLSLTWLTWAGRVHFILWSLNCWLFTAQFFFLLLLCCFSIKVKEVPSTLMKDSESLVVLWFSVPLRSGLFVVSNGENPTNTNVRSVPPPWAAIW